MPTEMARAAVDVAGAVAHAGADQPWHSTDGHRTPLVARPCASPCPSRSILVVGAGRASPCGGLKETADRQRGQDPAHCRRSGLEFGREQIADRQAPIRTPALRQLSDLVFGRTVFEAVDPLNRAPQREVAGEKHVRPIEGHE